jgi:integrase
VGYWHNAPISAGCFDVRSCGLSRRTADIDVTPHVLRHSCATLMLQSRVSTWDVAGVLGTSEAVVRKTYGHHCVEHLRDAVNVWSKRPTKVGAKARASR